MFGLEGGRKPQGAEVVVTASEFVRNFEECFAEGQLRKLNWDNVFAAGGSVMACLQPLPDKSNTNNRTRRQYMHDEGTLHSLSTLSHLHACYTGHAMRVRTPRLRRRRPAPHRLAVLERLDATQAQKRHRSEV